MSKATNQTLALLSVVAGAVSMMDKSNAFARLDMKQMVKDTYNQSCSIIEQWPGTGNEIKNVAWITRKVKDEWYPFILADDNRYGTVVLACMAERIVADLAERIRDKVKLELLKTIAQPLKQIHDFVDSEGRNFPAYEKADYALDELYRIVEWRW